MVLIPSFDNSKNNISLQIIFYSYCTSQKIVKQRKRKFPLLYLSLLTYHYIYNSLYSYALLFFWHDNSNAITLLLSIATKVRMTLFSITKMCTRKKRMFSTLNILFYYITAGNRNRTGTGV